MKDKARRVPERLQDMREAIANARDDLGATNKEESRRWRDGEFA